MATFNFSGSLPQTKALIASGQLRKRFNDIKDQLTATNPEGVSLPATSSGAQHDALLLNSGLNGFELGKVLRSNVSLSHDAGNGSSGQVLQSDGDGTTSWATTGALTDGNKGDITVAGGGGTWTLNNNSVSNPELATGAVRANKMGLSTASGSGIATLFLTPENSSVIEDSRVDLNNDYRLRNDGVANNLVPRGPKNLIVASPLAVNTIGTTEESFFANSSLKTQFDPDKHRLFNQKIELLANQAAAGDCYEFYATGEIGNNSSPVARFRMKLGSNVIFDTGSYTFAPGSALPSTIEFKCFFNFVSTNSIRCSGSVTVIPRNGGAPSTISDSKSLLSSPITISNINTNLAIDATCQCSGTGIVEPQTVRLTRL